MALCMAVHTHSATIALSCSRNHQWRAGGLVASTPTPALHGAQKCHLLGHYKESPFECRHVSFGALGRRSNVAAAVGAQHLGAVAAAAAAATAEVMQDAALRRWIQEHGGFVHESISVSSATECGSRGLVASAAIDLAELEASSLVVVPRGLHMDNAAAVAAIGPRLGSAARQEAFAALGQLQQVACCLAVERAKGDDSFWLPYLRTLPDSPPNPWLRSGTELAAALEEAAEAAAAEAAVEATAAERRREAAEAAADSELDHDWLAAEPSLGDSRALERREDAAAAAAANRGGDGSAWGWQAGLGGTDRSGWGAAVEGARRRYGAMAAEALEVLGPDAAGLCVDRDGLMWALGQVVSRSLGSGRSSGLLPFIDLANHHAAARPPMMMLDDADRIVFAVTSIRGGELAPLAAGQELFISYQAEDMSPLKAWLKWGFVPRCLPARGL